MKAELPTAKPRSMLVEPGKSRRLDAIRRQSQQAILADTTDQDKIKSVEPQLQPVFNQARELIDQKLALNISNYPAKMKNKLFFLRYKIQLEECEVKSFKSVFEILEINTQRLKHFKSIENYNYHGKLMENQDG